MDSPNHHMVVIAQEDIFITHWQKHAKYLYLFTIWLPMDLLHCHAPTAWHSSCIIIVSGQYEG